MSMMVTVTLDDEVGAYLERVAADQGRTAAELAAWIVTEDVLREQSIDADVVARLDEALAGDREGSDRSRSVADRILQRDQASA